MSEAEILSIRNDLTELIISVVSVSFGMISAYIVGLWLFLKDAPLGLRLLAFLLLSFGLAFMGGMTGGLHGLMLARNAHGASCRPRAWGSRASAVSGRSCFTGYLCTKRPPYSAVSPSRRSGWRSSTLPSSTDGRRTADPALWNLSSCDAI